MAPQEGTTCTASNCEQILSVGQPAGCSLTFNVQEAVSTKHIAVLPLDGRRRTQASLTAAAAAAVRLLPPAGCRAVPAGVSDLKRWNPRAIAAGLLPADRDDAPLVLRMFNAQVKAAELRLHGMVRRNSPAACQRAAATSLPVRAVRADELLLGVDAADLLAGRADNLMPYRDELLGVAADTHWPRLWLCVTGAEALFAHLGAGAARPHQLGSARVRQEVLRHLVLNATGLWSIVNDVLARPWREIGFLVAEFPIDQHAIAGMADFAGRVWSEANG